MQTVVPGQFVAYRKEKTTNRVISSTVFMFYQVGEVAHIFTPNNMSQVAAIPYEKEWMAKVIWSCMEIHMDEANERFDLSLVPEGVEVDHNREIFVWE